MSTSKKDRAKLGWIVGIAIWLAAGIAIYYGAQSRASDETDRGEPVFDSAEINTSVPEDVQD